MGIDRFLNEARAITNLVGNGVATIAVAKWEGALNLAQAKRAFAASGAGLIVAELMPTESVSILSKESPPLHDVRSSS
ncbi:C4-dicarboxylate transport domain protein [Collimonas pratensis]|uniref:C4-dicarboxylate transport domain protein n=1 Tax=Collimonas pratensis TaxID=279113 RepID=A0ABM5Z9P4_9BURK|nr:C4-dicarboxylate transport domain protein [Collimonas pratensis]